MTIVLFRFVFASLHENVRLLKGQLRVLRQHPGTTIEALIRAKHAALK